MSKHALLSASSSHRWMNCPPSARLCETYKDPGSSYAAEGTDAHALCEYKLQTALGIKARDPTPDLSYYDTQMDECSTGYAAYIMEIVETAKQDCPDPVVLIEQRLDFSKYVTDGYGTGDCVIIADGTLHVIDFKYGQGVLVEAEGNSQMYLYALGALELFDGIYDISEVSMTVYQPRRDNISTFTISKETLYQWADEILRPAAELATAGEGEFRCGDWCRFCRAKAECRKRAEENMKLAAYDFADPALLGNDEIAEILAKLDELTSWASDVKDYALAEALKGVKFDGLKLSKDAPTGATLMRMPWRTQSLKLGMTHLNAPSLALPQWKNFSARSNLPNCSKGLSKSLQENPHLSPQRTSGKKST